MCEFTYHAGNAHADGGEVDEEIHVVDLKYLAAAYALRAEILVHVGTGYICLLKNIPELLELWIVVEAEMPDECPVSLLFLSAP